MGAFWGPKWLHVGARGGTGGEKAILKKTLLYVRKTMFFEVRGARVRTQIQLKNCSENSSENHALLLRFVAILGPKMKPKWDRFGAKIE